MTTIVELHSDGRRMSYTMDMDLATLLIRLIKVRRAEAKKPTVSEALDLLKLVVPKAVAKVKIKRLADETMMVVSGGTCLFYDFGPREAKDLT